MRLSESACKTQRLRINYPPLFLQDRNVFIELYLAEDSVLLLHLNCVDWAHNKLLIYLLCYVWQLL